MDSGNAYHEPVELLSEATKNMHRALVSLVEEIQAIDWYQQRIDASSDEALAGILWHNKIEEIEHAMMTLEWIRRQDPDFDRMMRTYLHSEGPITELEAGAENRQAEPGGSGGAGDLGIGSLRERGEKDGPVTT